MLTKMKTDQTKIRVCRRTFSLFSRMTRSSAASPYVRMDEDAGEMKKKVKLSEVEDRSNDKENNKPLANKDVKEKKKKKRSWKRVRQAALLSCRYIGLGIANMSPGTAFGTPDYYVDPKCWDKNFSPSYKPKKQPQTPSWGSSMIFAGWM